MVPGEAAWFTVWRNGKDVVVPVRLGARPLARPPTYNRAMSDALSHVDESSGDVQMVDVGHKPPLRRKAVARGAVLMAPETARRLRELPKGDALRPRRLAGIMAAKRDERA